MDTIVSLKYKQNLLTSVFFVNIFVAKATAFLCFNAFIGTTVYLLHDWLEGQGLTLDGEGLKLDGESLKLQGESDYWMERASHFMERVTYWMEKASNCMERVTY